MQALRFRVPGRDLAWGELRARLAEATGAPRRVLDGARIESIDGRPPDRGPAAIAAGALVVVAGADVPAEAEETAQTFRALVVEPPWRRGQLPVGRRGRLDYAVEAVRGGVAALRIDGDALTRPGVLRALADAEMPVLGDARRGGILLAGGVRLRAATPGTERDASAAWPDEPVFPGWGAPSAEIGETADTGKAAASADAIGMASVRASVDPPRPRWSVSRETARVVAGGHPWLLPDRATDPPERFRPGTLVDAVAPSGALVGVVCIEGPGPIAARLWHRGGGGGGGGGRGRGRGRGPAAAPASVATRVAEALARRRRIVARGPARIEVDGRPHTDVLRLIHGEADGLPGLAVDRLGPLLRVLVTSPAAATTWLDPVLEALVGKASGMPGGMPGEMPGEKAGGMPSETSGRASRDRSPSASGEASADEDARLVGPARGVVVVLHPGGRPRGEHEAVRWWRAPADEWLDARGHLIVHERGLRFRVDPGLGEPTRARPGVGLFADQRDNRHRLAARARRGGRWLNLFAHTGAFSVALLAAGAEEVVSVDLSGAYLGWLDENLALNAAAGVDASRHRSVRRDGRRFLETSPSDERFDGIVLDPPTAAAAGRRYWSARRDLQPLVGAALERLAPGGVLLVSHNHRRGPDDLGALVEAAAAEQRVGLARVEPAGPAPDFPRLRGFREGDPFRGVLATRG